MLVPKGWKHSETGSKVFYYFHHRTNLYLCILLALELSKDAVVQYHLALVIFLQLEELLEEGTVPIHAEQDVPLVRYHSDQSKSLIFIFGQSQVLDQKAQGLSYTLRFLFRRVAVFLRPIAVLAAPPKRRF